MDQILLGSPIPGGSAFPPWSSIPVLRWAGVLGHTLPSLLFLPQAEWVSVRGHHPSGGVSQVSLLSQDRKGSPTEAELVGSQVSAHSTSNKGQSRAPTPVVSPLKKAEFTGALVFGVFNLFLC